MRSSVCTFLHMNIVMRAVKCTQCLRRTVAHKGIYLSSCGANMLCSLLVHVARVNVNFMYVIELQHNQSFCAVFV